MTSTTAAAAEGAWSYRTQYPDASLLVAQLDLHREFQDICHYVEDAVIEEKAFRHVVHTGNPEHPFVMDPSLRDSYKVVPDARPKLFQEMDNWVHTYWDVNFLKPERTVLTPSLSDYFYYPPGQGMALHSDDHRITTQGLVLDPDYKGVISAIVYLNDDFEGGDIEFPNQQVRIHPHAGMMVLFPSNKNFAHRVHPVTSGKRISFQRFYSLVFQ